MKCRLQLAREEGGKVDRGGLGQRIDRDDEQPGLARRAARSGTVVGLEHETREGAKQQHVVAVDHRGVGSAGVLLPGRAAIEGLERAFARRHVAEAAQPDEAVGIVEVPELAEHLHSDLFLRFDELPIEELDQRLPRTRTERVTA